VNKDEYIIIYKYRLQLAFVSDSKSSSDVSSLRYPIQTSFDSGWSNKRRSRQQVS